MQSQDFSNWVFKWLMDILSQINCGDDIASDRYDIM